MILDGRNRARACKAVGIESTFTTYTGDDPIAYVVSLNLHRRHLTAEQKRELIAKLIKMAPEKSNRQIAKTAKVDHKTVGCPGRAGGNWGNSPVGKDCRCRRQGA